MCLSGIIANGIATGLTCGTKLQLATDMGVHAGGCLAGPTTPEGSVQLAIHPSYPRKFSERALLYAIAQAPTIIYFNVSITPLPLFGMELCNCKPCCAVRMQLECMGNKTCCTWTLWWARNVWWVATDYIIRLKWFRWQLFAGLKLTVMRHLNMF